jgi:hypothetical protein
MDLLQPVARLVSRNHSISGVLNAIGRPQRTKDQPLATKLHAPAEILAPFSYILALESLSLVPFSGFLAQNMDAIRPPAFEKFSSGICSP